MPSNVPGGAPGGKRAAQLPQPPAPPGKRTSINESSNNCEGLAISQLATAKPARNGVSWRNQRVADQCPPQDKGQADIADQSSDQDASQWPYEWSRKDRATYHGRVMSQHYNPTPAGTNGEADTHPPQQAVTDAVRGWASTGIIANQAKSQLVTYTPAETDQLITLPPPTNAYYMAGVEDSGDNNEDMYHKWPDFLQKVDYPSRPDEEPQVVVDTDIEDHDSALEQATMIDAPAQRCIQQSMDSNQNAQFNCYYNWPFPAKEIPDQPARIYDAVRAAGTPNYRGARIPLPSPLHVDAWKLEMTGHEQDHMLIQGVTYGFPIQYTGGPSYAQQPDHNHPSADIYPSHVQDYFTSECRQGAIEGPFPRPPFTPWYRASPLMTRPKNEEGKRRVIVDLSFPEGGVNQYVQPHLFNGKEAHHNLPTTADLTRMIVNSESTDLRLAVIDISRAYRHFQVCPLDWPLLVLRHDKAYYFDRSLPFGSRMSSFVMQAAAQFIVRALAAKGIQALMYLDDLVLVAPADLAQDHYKVAIALLQRLGFAVAEHKLQPPAQKVVWLGVAVNLEDNTLSIPQKKLQEIQRGLAEASRKDTLTLKQLQRAIGQINHLSKIVHPARLFMGRLLEAIRMAQSDRIKVSRAMVADFSWFRRFLKQYNGRAIIPTHYKVREIWADACLQGGGATDGKYCYSYTFPHRLKNNHHITHLEAINCLAAARTFIQPEDEGSTIIINCDNLPAVNAFKGGRAKDPVLNACARAFWFLAAGAQVQFEFNHIPGEHMQVPDALSRAMTAGEHRAKAEAFISSMSLLPVNIEYKAFTFSSFYF